MKKDYLVLFYILIIGFIFVNGFRSNGIRSIHKYEYSRRVQVPLPREIPPQLMHLHHDHSHSHSHSHAPSSKISSDILKRDFWRRPKGAAFLIALSIFVVTAIKHKGITKLDLLLFSLFSFILSVFDVAKGSFRSWISKVAMVKDGIVKHSTPISSNYFFKNGNIADRITLLGVVVNLFLSISKFIGGIVFHSTVLVADAGHSLSDLFSDFITLWAVQVARIPADIDHPYGHGKFESIGALFLSLTLLATGISLGGWSYGNMINVLTSSQLKKSVVQTVGNAVKLLHNMGSGSHSHSIIQNVVRIPSWPALVLAGVSIIAKEWLFRITKQVGERLNSQILIANAWYGILYPLSRHHRSDSFSSILSVFSIAMAMYLPGFLFVDAAAGILIAGMICLTGVEILIESIKQLTDSLNVEIIPDIIQVALGVEGVKNVKNVRARSVGSSSLVDLIVVTDQKLSSSAAHTIAEKTRAKIIQSVPNVLDVLVKPQSIDLLCPLIAQQHRTIEEIESSVRQTIEQSTTYLLQQKQLPIDQTPLHSIHRMTVHYSDCSQATVEIVLQLKETLSLTEMKSYSQYLKEIILKEHQDLQQVDIQLQLSS